MRPQARISCCFCFGICCFGFGFCFFAACGAGTRRAGNASAAISGGCRAACGRHAIAFPIGIDAGCGTPGLLMTCNDGGGEGGGNSSSLALAIDSREFAVDSIDYASRALVLRDPTMSDCARLGAQGLGVDLTSSPAGLELGRNTVLLLNCLSLAQALDFLTGRYDCHGATCLAFVGGCHNRDLLTSCCRVVDPAAAAHIDLSAMQCSSYTSVYRPRDPVYDPRSWSYGIAVHWAEPAPALVHACDACRARNGVCGYEPRDARKFRCICRSSSLGCKGMTTAGGISVIAAAALCLMMLCPCQLRFRKLRFWKIRSDRSDRSDHSDRSDRDRHRQSRSENSGERLGVELAHVMAAMTGPTPLAVFGYEELRRATDGFSDRRLLGDGGYGAVYKAKLGGGGGGGAPRELAVKRLHRHVQHGRLQHFYNEVRILAQLKHANLVRLEGFCIHGRGGRELLLVYEYVSNGTLEEHIHGDDDPIPDPKNANALNEPKKTKTKKTTRNRLDWGKRLEIACEVASALAYLHFSVSPPIYHRDVKSGNILLDAELHAKVADFGLSRLVPADATHVSTGPQGTPGYVDPEYHQCYQVSDKSDVFSFGVVLLELLSGQRAVDVSRPRADVNLSSLAIDRIQKGAMEELFDAEIVAPDRGNVPPTARLVAELAFRCIASERRARPDMKEVCAHLDLIRSQLSQTRS